MLSKKEREGEGRWWGRGGEEEDEEEEVQEEEEEEVQEEEEEQQNIFCSEKFSVQLAEWAGRQCRFQSAVV